MSLLNDILDHEKAFNQYVNFLSVGDNEHAAEAANKVVAGLRETLGKIQNDYPTLLIESQIPDYLEDEKKLRAGNLSASDLADLATRLESYISEVSREVRRLHRREPSRVLAFLVRYRKAALTGVGAVLGLILLLAGVHRFIVRGRGLTAEYFGSIEMVDLYRKQVDPNIDFNWGRGGPFKKWRKNYFSVRWTGYLLVPENGRYDIYVHMDDGARLFLDDQPLVDDWRTGKTRVLQSSLDLKYGYHPIRLEYFENTKNATIRLFWKRGSSPRPEPIPSRFLCPSDDARKSGVPVFGTQPSPGAGSGASESRDDEDDVGESDDTPDTQAAPPPPPAKKG